MTKRRTPFSRLLLLAFLSAACGDDTDGGNDGSGGGAGATAGSVSLLNGEVQVRANDRGEVDYIFAGNSLSEATADGVCGAATTKEEIHGCLPAEY
jgi:hypothetical protein